MNSLSKGWASFPLLLALLASPLPVSPAAAQEGGKITLQFQEMEIIEILKLLAEQAGFNLVAGPNVTGKATLFVKEVDPWEAFEVILAANELAYERRGQILTVMSQRDYELQHGGPYLDRRAVKSIVLRYGKAADVSRSLAQVKSNVGRVIADESSNTLILMDTPAQVEQLAKLAAEMDRPLETRLFSINYGAVKTLGPLVQEAVTKGVGRVSVDERSNQLVVTDYPERLEEIAKTVKAFDERSTEVLIETKILQVALSDKFQLGIDWEVLARENVLVRGPQALNLTSGGILQVAQASLSDGGDYSLLVEALRTFGDAKILSEPRLTVVNNQEAKILVGTKQPYITRSTSQSGTGTAITAETVTFLDIGIKLYVTPTIARDGFVQMKVRPEVSAQTGTLTTSDNNEIPIIETTEAETVLLVEDGGTVILGGLIKDENSLDEQRIPVLGDLPVLGIPFRSTRKSLKKTELVVFLTPHIITGRRGENVGRKERFLQGPEAYEDLLRQRVQAIAGIQSAVDAPRGKVTLSVSLTPDGHVKEAPQILTAETEELSPLAKQAVWAASPFPAFPADAGEEPRTFQISLDYQ